MTITFQNIVYIFSVFVLGASFGSFFKLTADRYSTSDSIVSKPSYCFSCKKKINWFHNIPVFSYLYLKGKCAFCGEKIGFNSFLTEICSGLLASLFFIHFYIQGIGFASSILGILFVLVLAWLTVFDLQHRIVPHWITYSFIFLFLIYSSFVRDNYLSPLKDLGVAYFFMDSLYFMVQLFRKQKIEYNNILLPAFAWSILFYFYPDVNLAFLLSGIAFLFILFGFQVKSVFSNVILWVLLISFSVFYFIKLVFIDFDLVLFSLFFSGIGIIYLFCEVLLYFVSLFLPGDKPEEVESSEEINIALGGGDITVFALISVYLGYIKAFFALFLASVLALIWIQIARVFLKDKLVSQFIPFIPFIALACFIIIVAFKI